jgi:hypothetical protein
MAKIHKLASSVPIERLTLDYLHTDIYFLIFNVPRIPQCGFSTLIGPFNLRSSSGN